MRILLLILTWFASFAALAADLPASVVSALREAGIPQSAVGVWVQQVDAKKPLIQQNSNRAMNPASTMKLLTTSAALNTLSPAYTWHTEALTNASQQGDVLQGDLVLKGGGDPALTLERFWMLLRDLRQQGIREIAGDLVLDDSVFEVGSSDTLDGQSDRAYNAPPSALLVNFRAHNISFKPEAEKVFVSIDPALPALRLVNQLRVVEGPCEDWKGRIKRDVVREGDNVTVAFSGAYPRDCGEKTLELSVLDNTTYVGQFFTQLWRGQGGVFNGKVRAGTAPTESRLLLRGESLPLGDVIKLINKNSNNVMARQLLLTLGAEKSGIPSTPEKGVQVVRAWLDENKRDFPELVLENGAGLSRNERISAEHMGQLLTDQWRSSTMPEFMSSLPIVAVDGTMKKRLNSSSVAGQAHIKTGLLDGVKCMAGYVLDRKGQRWAVVMLVNHAQATKAGVAMDALLEWLYSR
ncbi:MAG: D-alanyl-D-alanine carboxypeptidase/D-alanyl-D-alanine-endopeptidase [Methylophilales bacterium]|nr:D-alanyl-D-alanine carboxypeptidase/D-alanyl-D-alanine-endopeptidase [Methylophilales bacterium]